MKKIIFSIIVAFAMILGVNATEKNEVTLNFEGGIIHNDYVEYNYKDCFEEEIKDFRE